MSDLIRAMQRGTGRGGRNSEGLKIRVSTATKMFTISGPSSLVEVILKGILASSRVQRIERLEGAAEIGEARLLVEEKAGEAGGGNKPF